MAGWRRSGLPGRAFRHSYLWREFMQARRGPSSGAGERSSCVTRSPDSPPCGRRTGRGGPTPPERSPAPAATRPGRTCGTHEWCLLADGTVDEARGLIETGAVPGIGEAAVRQVREGDAGVRVGPAVRGADAAVAEDTRRGEGAQAADGVGGPARVGPEPAVHRHAHVAVYAVARDVAGDVADHARGEQTHAVQRAAVGHHLIEGGHGPRGGIAAAPRRAGAPELWVVLLRAGDLARAVRGGLVHVHGARAGRRAVPRSTPRRCRAAR